MSTLRAARHMKLDLSHQVLVLVSLKVKSRREKLLGGEHVQGGGGEESSLCVALLPFTAFIYLQRGGWTYGGRRWGRGGERGREGCMFSFPAQPLRLQAARGEKKVEEGGREGGRQTEESRWKREI